MKLGAAIPVLNEWRFLPAVAGQLLKVCDRVVVLRNEKAFAGAKVKVKLSPPPPLDPRIEIVQGRWESELGETEGITRNMGMEHLSDCDFVFTVDSDEIFTVDALKEIATLGNRGHHAIACFLHTYWKSPRFEIDPPERICATVLLRRDMRFRHMRVLNGEPHILRKQLMHHLSFVRTDEEVKEKLRTYGHAHQIPDTWFEKVWKQWDRDQTIENLNPVRRTSFHRAVPARDAEMIQAILDEHGVT